MGQSNEYKIKYEQAKNLYLQGMSLTLISKELHIDRGILSKNLKKDNIEIINKQNITKFNENYFDIINTEEKAYWLGFLYADGAISSGNKNTIELSLKSSDVEHLKKFRKALGFNEDKIIYQDNIRCRFQFSNKHVKERLVLLGCPPKKSLILKFPTTEQVPDIFIYDFIRGYVDGDGSVMISKNNILSIKPRLSILGTKEFLEVLLEKTQWKKNKILNHSNVFSIDWNGKYVIQYLDQLYLNSTIYLDRKYQKYLTLKQFNNKELPFLNENLKEKQEKKTGSLT